MVHWNRQTRLLTWQPQWWCFWEYGLWPTDNSRIPHAFESVDGNNQFLWNVSHGAVNLCFADMPNKLLSIMKYLPRLDKFGVASCPFARMRKIVKCMEDSSLRLLVDEKPYNISRITSPYRNPFVSTVTSAGKLTFNILVVYLSALIL